MITKHDLFGLETVEDSKYTKKINIPQYMPDSVKPAISDMYDMRKYLQLLSDINVSNIPEEEKEFLRTAAARHIVFNYGKIADYYAHATPEVQELMEQSALVIIDFNDAIANGYVKLSKNIKDLMEKTGRPAGSKDEE